jgi:DNA-binding protein
MSMGERKVFLSTVQSILDKVAPGVDVKQLKFKTGYLTLEDARNGKQAVLLDVADDRILQGKRDEIEKAINKNTRIVNLKLQADASPNKSNGQLTISVLDASGQELPKNEVRLIADGKSITTTVETIKNMDQMQMLAFVRAA